MPVDPGSADPQRNDLLAQIKNGMKVLDAEGEEVGTVSFVQMADLNDPDDNPGRDDDVGLLDPLVADSDDDDEGLLDAFEIGGGDVTERMRRSGYVKIDASGIFAGDKYVVPSQVEGVGDNVRLNVRKDDIPHPA